MEKIKEYFSHENFHATVSYLTSGGLIGSLFAHFNDIVQGIAGILGIAIGVQRFMYDRQRFKDKKNDRGS